MQNLFKKIVDAYSEKGLPQVGALLHNSGEFGTVQRMLESMGYDLSVLDEDGIACLFFALNDILIVREGESFYLCTLSMQKLKELFDNRRIIPKTGEGADMMQTRRLITSNTIGVINDYLAQGKFHVLRLNVVEACQSYYFMASVGHMNPYPTFRGKTVYALSSVVRWHSELSNQLTKGYLKLLLVGGSEVICHNYLSRSATIPTSCTIMIHDNDNTARKLYIWDITYYFVYNESDFVLNLMNGIVRYDGVDVTLNRDILEKYYGKQLYTSLESIGVRRKYCYEELLSVGTKYSVQYYVNKYNLEIYDCDDIYSLEKKLATFVKKDTVDDGIVHARVLYSADAIRDGHRSFYQNIVLSKVDEHTVEQIEDVQSVLPREYWYYAISEEMGYSGVKVSATSVSLAKKYGEIEFTRQFGKQAYFCSLILDGNIIAGAGRFNISVSSQYNLCQSLLYGYTQNYDGIKKGVSLICENNGIHGVDDDCIKFLFINRLARQFRDSAKIKLHDSSKALVDFMVLMQDTNKMLLALNEEFTKIAVAKAKKEFAELNRTKAFDLYDIEDTKEGKFIQTDYGRFKITKTGISSNVDIYYRGRKMCSKRFS